MGAGAAEPDSESVRERAELRPPLGDARDHVGEGVTPARPDLDLGRDQLADKVLLELGALGESPAPRSGSSAQASPDRESRTPPRRRREVLRRLELLTRLLQQDAVVVSHPGSLLKGLQQPVRHGRPAPALDRGSPRGGRQLGSFSAGRASSRPSLSARSCASPVSKLASRDGARYDSSRPVATSASPEWRATRAATRRQPLRPQPCRRPPGRSRNHRHRR